MMSPTVRTLQAKGGWTAVVDSKILPIQFLLLSHWLEAHTTPHQRQCHRQHQWVMTETEPEAATTQLQLRPHRTLMKQEIGWKPLRGEKNDENEHLRKKKRENENNPSGWADRCRAPIVEN